MRFYEKVLKAQRSIINMEKEQMDPYKQLEYEFFERLYNTHIKYYIGLHYTNERNYQEAFLILQKVSADIEGTIEFAQKNALQGQKIKRDLAELEDNMLKSLNFLLVKCHARVLQTQHEQYVKNQQEMTMDLDSVGEN